MCVCGNLDILVLVLVTGLHDMHCCTSPRACSQHLAHAPSAVAVATFVSIASATARAITSDPAQQEALATACARAAPEATGSSLARLWLGAHSLAPLAAVLVGGGLSVPTVRQQHDNPTPPKKHRYTHHHHHQGPVPAWRLPAHLCRGPRHRFRHGGRCTTRWGRGVVCQHSDSTALTLAVCTGCTRDHCR